MAVTTVSWIFILSFLGTLKTQVSSQENDQQDDITVYVGATADLPCHFDNVGTRLVVWQIGNSPYPITIGPMVFTDDPRISSIHGTSTEDWNLRIRDVALSDAGQYTCFISGRDRRRSRILNLNVLEQPVETTTAVLRTNEPTFISEGNQNITVDVGNTAVLPCSIRELGNYRVLWSDSSSAILTLDDRRLVDDPRISVERPFRQDWNLHIRTTTLEDSGPYTCQINTNPVRRQIVNLNVAGVSRHQGFPSIVTHPEDFSTPKNVPATLNCQVTGVPTPAISWYHNGQLLLIDNLNSLSTKMVLENGQLFFLSVLPADAGVYYCRAMNRYGTARSRTATLTVSDQVILTTEPTSTETDD